MNKTIEPEELQKYLDMMKKQPVQIMPTEGDDRERQMERLVENMRWTGLTDRLDDIRDLMFINNLNQGAILELMIGGYNTPLAKRHAIDEALGGAKQIAKSMKERNEKAKKHIESLMAEYNAILKGGST